jgi:putative sterol carrier protein
MTAACSSTPRSRLPEVSHDDKESDCTLICSLDTFDGILNGTKDPNIAFMMGQLKGQRVHRAWP